MIYSYGHMVFCIVFVLNTVTLCYVKNVKQSVTEFLTINLLLLFNMGVNIFNVYFKRRFEYMDQVLNMEYLQHSSRGLSVTQEERVLVN